MWDTTTEFGQRVERRLAEELVIWLVTTDRGGTPQPKPVWFIREGESLLIYSQPDTAKVRHVQERPQVALNFNTDAEGDDVIVLLGTAAIDPSAPPANRHAAFGAKYAQAIPGINMTPEQFAASYSVAIRVTLKKVRGW
jgi:PPOX class probable F420-dependent enzyme